MWEQIIGWALLAVLGLIFLGVVTGYIKGPKSEDSDKK